MTILTSIKIAVKVDRINNEVLQGNGEVKSCFWLTSSARTELKLWTVMVYCVDISVHSKD